MDNNTTENNITKNNIKENNNTENNNTENNNTENNNTENNITDNNTPKLRGLYRHVKVSVPTLNLVIIGGIAAIVIILAIGLLNPGYVVNFDTLGGTRVESVKLMYGDLVPKPEDPTREGYEFAGWYTDENYNYIWNMDTDTMQGPMTLYAKWEEKN